jgi:hypothetical protein
MHVLDEGVGREQGEDPGRPMQSSGIVADPDYDPSVLRADTRDDACQQSELSEIGDARPAVRR